MMDTLLACQPSTTAVLFSILTPDTCCLRQVLMPASPSVGLLQLDPASDILECALQVLHQVTQQHRAGHGGLGCQAGCINGLCTTCQVISCFLLTGSA
jgi:hypothetical protein